MPRTDGYIGYPLHDRHKSNKESVKRCTFCAQSLFREPGGKEAVGTPFELKPGEMFNCWWCHTLIKRLPIDVAVKSEAIVGYRVHLDNDQDPLICNACSGAYGAMYPRIEIPATSNVVPFKCFHCNCWVPKSPEVADNKEPMVMADAQKIPSEYRHLYVIDPADLSPADLNVLRDKAILIVHLNGSSWRICQPIVKETGDRAFLDALRHTMCRGPTVGYMTRLGFICNDCAKQAGLIEPCTPVRLQNADMIRCIVCDGMKQYASA